ncbi:TPA: tetratricopeptide repeat protein YfbP, partial [Escherichia coli]
MKLIPRSSDISPGIDGICPGPFPPNGFTVLTDAAYGNGDCFGLYWPIGQEHKLPIVCETYHDEWRIVPAFSSIKKFEEWLEVNDDDPHENGISIEDQDF